MVAATRAVERYRRTEENVIRKQVRRGYLLLEGNLGTRTAAKSKSQYSRKVSLPEAAI